MREGVAYIDVDTKSNRIVANVDWDFTAYYNWFIARHYKFIPSFGRYPPHISISLPKFSKNINWGKAKSYHGKKVKFKYDGYVIEGGKSKGTFMNFWMRIHSDEIRNVAANIGADMGNGLHLTISSTKGHTLPFWGTQISIKG